MSSPAPEAPSYWAYPTFIQLTSICGSDVDEGQRVPEGAGDLVMYCGLVYDRPARLDDWELLLPFGKEGDVGEGLVGVGDGDEDEGKGGYEGYEHGFARQACAWREEHGL